jgi:hypothetical protein
MRVVFRRRRRWAPDTAARQTTADGEHADRRNDASAPLMRPIEVPEVDQQRETIDDGARETDQIVDAE